MLSLLRHTILISFSGQQDINPLQLGTGLTNLGKSCYQNAIFQVF
jgi:ubiquitin C-terminal hydrolase